jgi:hypothetical protein
MTLLDWLRRLAPLYPAGVIAVLLIAALADRHPPGSAARVACCWIGAAICVGFWVMLPLVFWRRLFACAISY